MGRKINYGMNLGAPMGDTDIPVFFASEYIPKAKSFDVVAFSSHSSSIGPIEHSAKHVVAYVNRVNRSAQLMKRLQQRSLVFGKKIQSDFCSLTLHDILSLDYEKSVDSELNLVSNEKFMPSNNLVRLISLKTQEPSPEEYRYFSRMRDFHGLSPINFPNETEITEFISDEIEGLLDNIAKRSENYDKDVYITDNGRFTTAFCEEIIERFQLDPYDPRPVLDSLYLEFFNFTLNATKERKWGKFFVENNNIKLELNQEAIVYNDAEMFGDDYWIELK